MPTMDFETARHNMIEQQIRPWDVLDPLILETLATLKREDFVPPAHRALAFTDMEIPLDVAGARTGETMLAPKVEARLLQAAAPRLTDSVLEIGTGSGFMAALLATHAQRVASWEIRPELADFARANLARAGLDGVSVHTGNGLSALAGGVRFDLIVLSGAVDFIPDSVIAALQPGGRVVAIVGEPPVMTARLISRSGTSATVVQVLFDTLAKSLAGFPKKEAFVF